MPPSSSFVSLMNPTAVVVVALLLLLSCLTRSTSGALVLPSHIRQRESRHHHSRAATPLSSSLSMGLILPNHHKKNNRHSSGGDLVTSRLPHRLADGRGTFLGFRNARDLPASLRPRRPSSSSPSSSSQTLQSSVQPLMPDGGLSPCVIRVLGVGGGGCNAVRKNIGPWSGGGHFRGWLSFMSRTHSLSSLAPTNTRHTG